MKQDIEDAAMEYIQSEHENNFYAEDITVTLMMWGNEVDVESIWLSKQEKKIYLHVGCEEFEGDLDIESLSDENQERLRVAFFCAEPQEVEFYSISCNEGGIKYIHIFGYSYIGEDNGEGPWRNVEYTGFIEPLQEFIEHLKANEDYVDNTAANLNQYMGDYTDEGMRDIMNCYFNGHRADRLLNYSEITMDTPCGDYMMY